MSADVQGDMRPIQGLPGSAQENQGQRSLRARPNLARLGIPNPPRECGLQTELQLTSESEEGACPGLSCLIQMKVRISLFICLRTPGRMKNAMR